MEEQPKENKTTNRAKYQREYMKKRYDENKEKCRGYASATYYVRIGAATKVELKTYGYVLPYIVKAQTALDELKQLNHDMFLNFIESIDKSPPLQKIDHPPEKV
jgi:hypothetical protein